MGLPSRNIICIFLLIATVNLYSEELVKNGNFEEVEDNLPKCWNLYLEPAEGAFGEIDKSNYHTGNCSVFITHSKQYKREPLNNWNQRIVISNNINKVEFEGFIKTKGATKAYFLIQFWNNTGKIINSVKTDEVKGTNGWTQISKVFDITNGTSFVMLRCVLEGVGTAWFDDVSMKSLSENDSKISSNIENTNVILDRLEKIEKEINDIRAEYLYLRNRVDELEKRLYMILENLIPPKSNDYQKLNSYDEDKNQILPNGITLEDIHK